MFILEYRTFFDSHYPKDTASVALYLNVAKLMYCPCQINEYRKTNKRPSDYSAELTQTMCTSRLTKYVDAMLPIHVRYNGYNPYCIMNAVPLTEMHFYKRH